MDDIEILKKKHEQTSELFNLPTTCLTCTLETISTIKLEEKSKMFTKYFLPVQRDCSEFGNIKV